ncbi:Uncharacterised protein [Cedecea neteri]|nr:Uncharacterised protein [Cedecea neteri]
MAELLYEMILTLTEDLKAPRFVRSSTGELKNIEAAAVTEVH